MIAKLKLKAASNFEFMFVARVFLQDQVCCF